MPTRTVVEMPQEEHAQMLAARRRARYGDVRARHMLLWCAAGRHPTDIAAGLFGSRARVSRMVRASRAGTLGLAHDDQGQLMPQGRPTVLLPPCAGHCWPDSRRLLGPMAGAAPAGAVPRGLPPSRPHEASRGRLSPCGAGSTRSAGCGSGPSAWPQMTTRLG